MPNNRQIARHEALCLRLIDIAEAQGGTPEQCGALLSDAVSPPAAQWYNSLSAAFLLNERERRAAARRRIRELLGIEDGEELMRLEREVLYV